MKKPIILIGGGGHCISCIDIIEQGGEYEIIGILDLPEKVGQNVLGYPIIGSEDELEKYLPDCNNFHITVGQIDNSLLREKIYLKVKDVAGILPVIVSPAAYVSRHAQIGEGTIVMHRAFINAGASVGKNCILNSNSLVEHEAEIGNFCHISTSAIANGQVKIGRGCFIGSNTVIGNDITITENVVIAAGCQVLRSIKLPGVYIGNPLRKIR